MTVKVRVSSNDIIFANKQNNLKFKRFLTVHFLYLQKYYWEKISKEFQISYLKNFYIQKTLIDFAYSWRKLCNFVYIFFLFSKKK